MADQDPGGRRDFSDLGERIRRHVHDEIEAKLNERRARLERKLARRQRIWEHRAAYRRAHPYGGLLAGLILAGIGVILLLQNLGIPFAEDLWDYWPVILIVVGGLRLASAWDTGGRIWGGIVASAGAIFLLRNLGLLPGNVWEYFWPVILIAIGLGLLIRAIDGNPVLVFWPPRRSDTPTAAGAASTGSGDLRNSFHEDHVFSGAKRRLETQEFEGGQALVIFGGLEMDLRKADTKRDDLFIEANAIFGGIELRVPESWAVTVRGTGVFGGYVDETMQPPAGNGRHPHLVVTGAAIFGGVTVKN